MRKLMLLKKIDRHKMDIERKEEHIAAVDGSIW